MVRVSLLNSAGSASGNESASFLVDQRAECFLGFVDSFLQTCNVLLVEQCQPCVVGNTANLLDSVGPSRIAIGQRVDMIPEAGCIHAEAGGTITN